jgi:nucleoside-diphosphate-sugar epimerase
MLKRSSNPVLSNHYNSRSNNTPINAPSIADKELINKVFTEYKPAVVVNLAAQAGVRYSIDHPDVYIESNLIGFYNILEACRNYPVEHLV